MFEFKGEKKKPFKLGTVTTVDAETGEVVEEKHFAMTLLPPGSEVCQECAVDHPHDQPHNQQSLYYKYAFFAKHDRWPTWTDAMRHCTPEVRAQWRPLLVERMKANGMEIPDDLKTE